MVSISCAKEKKTSPAESLLMFLRYSLNKRMAMLMYRIDFFYSFAKYIHLAIG